MLYIQVTFNSTGRPFKTNDTKLLWVLPITENVENSDKNILSWKYYYNTCTDKQETF